MMHPAKSKQPEITFEHFNFEEAIQMVSKELETNIEIPDMAQIYESEVPIPTEDPVLLELVD